MPLKIHLRANEKIIINGAVLGFGDRPVSICLYNMANFLRGNDILKEEEIDCPEKKIYFLIQLSYIFPDDAARTLALYREASAALRGQRPELRDTLDEVEALVGRGDLFRALKVCGRLFQLPRQTTGGGN